MKDALQQFHRSIKVLRMDATVHALRYRPATGKKKRQCYLLAAFYNELKKPIASPCIRRNFLVTAASSGTMLAMRSDSSAGRVSIAVSSASGMITVNLTLSPQLYDCNSQSSTDKTSIQLQSFGHNDSSLLVISLESSLLRQSLVTCRWGHVNT